MEDKNDSKTQLIFGKVAGILTARELTINIGSTQGVKEGMKFKVLAKEPIGIYDPGTNEKLGVVDREKVRVKATEVNDKFSICRTYRKWENRGSSLASLAYIYSSMQWEKQETLKVSDSSLPQPLSEEDSYVKTGDRVIQIIEDEE